MESTSEAAVTASSTATEDATLRYPITLTVLYSVVLLLALYQFGRIVLYRHSVKSFQSIFLVFCLVFSLLRVIYWTIVTCQLADDINIYVLGMLYWIPSTVQFATFSFLVLFYARVIHRRNWENYSTCYYVTYGIVNGTLLIITLVWYWIFGLQSTLVPASWRPQIVRFRVGYQALLWITLSFFIAIYAMWLLRVMKTSNVQLPFSVKNMSNGSIVATNLFLFLVFVSRSSMDVLAISVPSLYGLRVFANAAVLTFWVFLGVFLWEIVPALIVLVLFRKIPKTGRQVTAYQDYASSTDPSPPPPTFPTDIARVRYTHTLSSSPGAAMSLEEQRALLAGSMNSSYQLNGSYGHGALSNSSYNTTSALSRFEEDGRR